MTNSNKDSDGKWTERPTVPGSVTWLKRELEKKNRRLVAAHDVIEAARQMLEDEHPYEGADTQEVMDALEAYDKAMERENG